MNLHMHSDAHISQNNTERTPPALSPSPVITPTKSGSRGPLIDLTGWPSYSDRRTQAPGGGSINGGVHQSGSFSSETHSVGHALGVFHNPSHLPTPQSPGNMSSYLRDPLTSLQNSQPKPESSVLPTEFLSYPSPSPPPPFRPHAFPTPESSPLVARSRGDGFHLVSQPLRTDDDNGGSPTLSKIKNSQSRESTPIPVRQPSTRPATPFNPTTSAPTRSSVTQTDNVASDDPLPISPSPHRVQDEAGGEIARIRAQLIENHLALSQATELRRPEYFKRTRRMAQDPESSSSTAAGGASLPSDIGGKNGSFLWASTNTGVIDSPMKGRRITLFQETSDESFEESLMAGGYGRYRSDRPWWKPEQDAEVLNRPDDTLGEETFGSGVVLNEEEKRKKARLSAFFDPPLASSSKTPLFPVEIEGCGRVLVRLEPSEPQLPHKPSSSKAKRSRKRKKVSADQKRDVDPESAVAQDLKIDEPNWPDAEFPWRSWLQDGLSIAEREERLRHIESFLDRYSEEEDNEEGGWRSPDRLSSRSPRPGQGKMYPLLSHSKDRRHGSTTLAVIPSDPADAKTALLSKKSVRAVQKRLLRHQMMDRDADGDSGETVCICQGRDDGRPLVQCDACRTWYHLGCIGIQNTSELGREEDPWFCANCVEVKTPPPVTMPLSEPTFVQTEDEELGVGHSGSVGPGGYDPPFFNAGLNPSPMTPWTRVIKPPTTPPRLQQGPSWEEPSSSSSRGGPRTPQFNRASAFGDMVRVYGTTPGRSLEASSSTTDGFDPTSTPSRGIRFGVPFMTPKDGMWGSSWQGVRGGQELFHTPYRSGQRVNRGGQPVRFGQHLLYPARVEEVSEERRSGAQGNSLNGPNDTTPVGRDAFGTSGSLHAQVLESPLGTKRSRRMIN